MGSKVPTPREGEWLKNVYDSGKDAEKPALQIRRHTAVCGVDPVAGYLMCKQAVVAYSG